MKWCDGLSGLVRRGGRWNQVYLFQLQVLTYLLRRSEMPQMYRIEGAAENAQSQKKTPEII